MGSKTVIAPILITGMHHSGIGLVAHYLKRQGLFLGSQFISNDINYQEGYLEDKDFEQLQSNMLNSMYHRCKKGWPDWGYCEDPQLKDEMNGVYANNAIELIAQKNITNIPWGWVDSRTTMLLDFWHDVNPNNKYIFIYRNPLEVKKSILSMDVDTFNKHPEWLFKIWKLYNKSLLEFYNQHKEQCLLVSFDTFIEKPETLVTQLKAKFNIEISDKNIKDYSFCVEDINTGLNTFEELDAFNADAECAEILKQLNSAADIPSTQFLDKAEKPEVSIIIASYNDAKMVENAIVNIETTGVGPCEIIVVNDGAKDKSNDKYLHKIEQRGHKIFHKENGGSASARNFGIKQAQADIILVLDADNSITPEYISKGLEVLKNQPDISVVYSNPRFAGELNELKQLPEFDIERLLSRNFIDACALFRKQMWQDLGGFDESLRGFEDWEFWINAAGKGYKFYHINECLYEYTVRGDSKSKNNSIPENRYQLLKHITTKHKDLYSKYAVDVVSYLNKEHAEVMMALKESHQQIHQYNAQYGIPSGGGFKGKLSKFKTLVKKVKHILMSPVFAPEEKRKWLQRIKFLLSSRGLMLVRKFFKILFKYAYILFEHKKVTIILGDKLLAQSADKKYNYWILKNAPREKDLEQYKENLPFLTYQPKISLVVPAYNSPLEYLKQMFDSVIDQIYPNWELCIADDNSPKAEVRELIKEYAERDERIKYVFRKENGHISQCSNSAIEIATGEFIALLDHDDLLTPDALYQVVFELNKHPETDFIYSDEDKVDDKGYLSEPHFKPDWSPDNLLTRNYITHFAVLRADILKRIGGFRVGFEGSQDYDLFLRYTEQTDKIRHIPKVLYHWRLHNDSASLNFGAKNYAYTAGERAIQEAIDRRKMEGKVKMNGTPGYYQINYAIKRKGKVSIIIPSKNKANILSVCLNSIYSKTSYDDYEIILIDNNSSEESFFKLIDEYKQKPNFKYYKHDIPFNYAALMNYAVERSAGEYILLLNNDTEVIHDDWIEKMVQQVQRESIGVAGAKLYYPNNTVQHAGVIIGMHGLAGHTFVGQSKQDVGYYNYLNVVSNYSAVTGACMMFRRDVYDAVKGFDEDFAIEYNDIDFCLRVKEKGYDNIFIPNVELYHHESISRGNPMLNKSSIKRHIYETDLFRSKWQNYIDHDPCYNPNLSREKVNFEIDT